jgi:hypothetical protein
MSLVVVRVPPETGMLKNSASPLTGATISIQLFVSDQKPFVFPIVALAPFQVTSARANSLMDKTQTNEKTTTFHALLIFIILTFFPSLAASIRCVSFNKDSPAIAGANYTSRDTAVNSKKNIPP